MKRQLFETEVKLQITEPADAECILRDASLHANVRPETWLERDEYYDTEGGDLARADLTVRLRSSAGTIKIAMKSPRVFSPDGIHKRIELEFIAADAEGVRRELLAKGLQRRVVIEKRRSSVEYADALVVVDRLPFIGIFVEVEGADGSAVQATIHALGLGSAPVVRENYSELLERRMGALGLRTQPVLEATFDAEDEWLRLARPTT